MNDRGRSAISLSTLTLLGLTVTCAANAGADREERRTIEQVRSCVSEIAKHADYADSSRAIHWVERLNQMNLVELEIRIETTVYSSDDQEVHRKYRSSCVIAGRNDLLKFRIQPIELLSEAQNKEI